MVGIILLIVLQPAGHRAVRPDCTRRRSHGLHTGRAETRQAPAPAVRVPALDRPTACSRRSPTASRTSGASAPTSPTRSSSSRPTSCATASSRRCCARRSSPPSGPPQELRGQAKREAELILSEAHAEARAVTRRAAAERERLARHAHVVRARLEAALDTLDEADRGRARGDGRGGVTPAPNRVRLRCGHRFDTAAAARRARRDQARRGRPSRRRLEGPRRRGPGAWTRQRRRPRAARADARRPAREPDARLRPRGARQGRRAGRHRARTRSSGGSTAAGEGG